MKLLGCLVVSCFAASAQAAKHPRFEPTDLELENRNASTTRRCSRSVKFSRWVRRTSATPGSPDVVARIDDLLEPAAYGMMRGVKAILLVIALGGCSGDEKTGTEAPPAKVPAAPKDAAAAPVESTTVVAPTRSAKGALDVAGAITGTFEWRKREQKTPISCAWDAAKEIGSFHVDLSDGAGKIITLGLDVPTVDVGLPKLDVSSKDLPAPLKTSLGFNVTGDDSILITVKLDAKLGDEKKPDLTIKGTLEVSCPRKK